MQPIISSATADSMMSPEFTSSSGLAVLCAFLMKTLSEYRVTKKEPFVTEEERRKSKQGMTMTKSASWSTLDSRSSSSNSSIRTSITGAIGDMNDQHGGGSDFGYILKQFHPKAYIKDPSKSNVRKRWLIALTKCVSAITKDMGLLMDTLFSSYDWLDGEDDDLFLIYQSFIENVVAANAYMALPCMKMLVKSFRYRKLVGIRDASSQEKLLERSHRRAHDILFHILEIVPTAPLNLVSLIAEEFPDKRESYQHHVYFLKNVLSIAETIQLLQEQLLSIVIEKLIQIDVEIQVEIDDFEDEALEDIFKMDIDEDGEEIDHQKEQEDIVILDEDDSDEDSDQVILFNVHQLIRKLDQVLKVFFEYMSRWKRRVELEEIHEFHIRERLVNEFFSLLLTLFDRIILKTHRCRYVQFILFYACSLDPSFPDMFLGFLVQKLLSPSTTDLERHYLIAYLASFVARANYLQMSSVKMCIDLILPWIHAYLDEHDELNVVSPDLEKHGFFYAMCQALFYIYCFRHLQLREHYTLDYMRQWGLERLINSKLNPLKVCASSVVNEFARITHSYELVYCYVILEKNKKLALPILSSHQDTLETFFPFDPYRLRDSSLYILSHYQDWKDTTTTAHLDTDDQADPMRDETVPYMRCSKSKKIIAMGLSELDDKKGNMDSSLSGTSAELDSFSLSPDQPDLLLARFEMRSPTLLAD